MLRSWQEYELAIIIINYGKKLLDSSQTTSRDHSGVLDGEEMHIDTDAEDEVITFFRIRAPYHNNSDMKSCI